MLRLRALVKGVRGSGSSVVAKKRNNNVKNDDKAILSTNWL